MYKSLLNIYVIFTELKFHKQNCCLNVFSIILDSHANSMNDVIDTLFLMSLLNCEMKMNINNQQIKVCVYTLAFFENMSQQNENADFKQHNVLKDCRFCLIDQKEQEDLNYNHIINAIVIVLHGTHQHHSLKNLFSHLKHRIKLV